MLQSELLKNIFRLLELKNFKFQPPYSKTWVNVMYNTTRFKGYNLNSLYLSILGFLSFYLNFSFSRVLHNLDYEILFSLTYYYIIDLK